MATSGEQPPPIRRNHLPYAVRLEQRPPHLIDLVVIHCTELPDLATARSYGERVHYAGTGTGNCGHYYIDRDGSIEEWVAPERIAHHARGYNARSVGLELVNRGRYPDWLHSGCQVMTEPYARPQLDSLDALLHWLQMQLPSLRWIAGHEALDTGQVPASDDSSLRVRRKRDPGPLFPWGQLLRSTGLQWLPDSPPPHVCSS